MQLVGLFAGCGLGWVVRYIDAVRRFLSNLLEPRTKPIDPAADTWYRRAALGSILCACVTTAAWKGADPTAWSQTFDRWLEGAGIAVVVSAVCMAGASVLLIAAEGARTPLIRRLRGPWAAAIVVVGTTPAAALVLPYQAELTGRNPMVGLLILPAWFILGITALIVIWHGGRLALRHSFRTADAHPTMRALVVIGLPAYTFSVGLVSLVQNGDDPAFPWWVELGFAILGPIINMLLAARELWALESEHGIGIRTEMVES